MQARQNDKPRFMMTRKCPVEAFTNYVAPSAVVPKAMTKST